MVWTRNVLIGSDRLMEKHISDGHYPGAQITVARDGKLVKSATFGLAKIYPESVAADDDTLWLMFSQTKVIVTAALWQLVEAGVLRFADRISDHVPEFAANGKSDITLFEVITHQGGFPSAEVPEAAWEDHELLRGVVSDFRLEWTPGSKGALPTGLAAHWVAAVVIEAVTGTDYRYHIRSSLLEPLGLEDRIFVGVSEDADGAVRRHPRVQGRGDGAVGAEHPRVARGWRTWRWRVRNGDGPSRRSTRCCWRAVHSTETGCSARVLSSSRRAIIQETE